MSEKTRVQAANPPPEKEAVRTVTFSGWFPHPRLFAFSIRNLRTLWLQPGCATPQRISLLAPISLSLPVFCLPSIARFQSAFPNELRYKGNMVFWHSVVFTELFPSCAFHR